MFTLRTITSRSLQRTIRHNNNYVFKHTSLSSTQQAIHQFSTTSALSEGVTETGKVKFYQTGKAFGFIISDVDNQDIFIHRTDIVGAPPDDNFNPVLKDGERVKFKRTLKDGSDNLYQAQELVFEDGSQVPLYRPSFIKNETSKAKKLLGERVYDILSQGGDEEEMAQQIAEAYTKTKDRIAAVREKLERAQ